MEERERKKIRQKTNKVFLPSSFGHMFEERKKKKKKKVFTFQSEGERGETAGAKRPEDLFIVITRRLWYISTILPQ